MARLENGNELKFYFFLICETNVAPEADLDSDKDGGLKPQSAANVRCKMSTQSRSEVTNDCEHDFNISNCGSTQDRGPEIHYQLIMRLQGRQSLNYQPWVGSTSMALQILKYFCSASERCSLAAENDSVVAGEWI